MKKLVLKTIGITLASLLVAVSLLFGIFVLFFPKNIAKVFDSLGNDKLAVYYCQRAYEKSNSVNDLDTLCFYAVKSGDNGLIAEHLSKLFVDDGFKNYCLEENKGVEYYDFMASKYIVAEFSSGKGVEPVIEKAFSITDDYRKGSAAYTVLRCVVSFCHNPDGYLNTIKNEIETSVSGYSDAGATLARADLDVINELLS